VASSTVRCGLHLCGLDYEREKKIDVAVNVTDNGTPPLSRFQVFTISVEDTNDPPRDVRLVGGVVRENKQPGTIVGMNLSLIL